MSIRKALFWERDFTRHVLKLAVPITLQGIVTALMTIVDNLMIGQLGEVELAAVTQANRISFLFQLALFGTVGGVNVFAAQYWGRRDLGGVHRAMSMGLRLALIAASVFALPALLIPEKLLSLLLANQDAVALGAQYLRIVAVMYYVQCVSMILAAVLKSTEQVRLPMFAGMAAIMINALFNYLLIFDHGAFGGYGVRGAAMATLIGACCELIILLTVSRAKHYACILPVRELFVSEPGFAGRYLKSALPVMFNECMWSLGITCYSVVYGRMGDGVSAVAAVSIFMTVEQLALVSMRGMNFACGVLVGGAVGRDDRAEAKLIADRIRVWGVIILETCGMLLMLVAPYIVSLFKVEPATAESAVSMLRLFSVMIWLHGLYTVTIVGILRAGGDVRWSALMDVLPVWLVGIPLIAFTGLVLKWPIQYVYMMTYVVNLIQVIAGSLRIRSGKWIRNLVK